MGNSCCCCCNPPGVKRSNSAITGYVHTGRFVRFTFPSGPSVSYGGPASFRAVYIQNERLQLEPMGCCRCCESEGYPVRSLISAEVVRGESVAFTPSMGGVYLNPGVKMTGADRTIIAFSCEEDEGKIFVERVREMMEKFRNEFVCKAMLPNSSEV